MPFLRFTRDKRGYEQFALVHPTTNRRGKVRTRVLYWYRTPPGVRVGREPFDDSMRRALEAQNPDIVFDWRKIVETPIPSAETEKWRERRRAEKAEKAARRAAAASESSSEDSDEVDVPPAREGSAEDVELVESRGEAPQYDDSLLESERDEDGDAERAEPELRVVSELTIVSGSPTESDPAEPVPAEPELRHISQQTEPDPAELDLRHISQQTAASGAPVDSQRRRRRRRRGRRNQGSEPAAHPQAPPKPSESDDSHEPE